MSTNLMIESTTIELLTDAASRENMGLKEFLEMIAGDEYERQQIESSKG